MAKSDLLKEAIADAKAVKETALANAKIALQEAFQPRIKSMLENELISELEDEVMDDELAGAEAEMADAEVEGDMSMEPEMDVEMEDGPMDVGDIEIDTDMDGEIDFTGDIMSKPGADMGSEDDMADMEMDMDAAEGDMEDMGDELADDEMGLEEIIKELEEDLDEGSYSNEDESNEIYMAENEEEFVFENEDDVTESKSIDDLIEAILAEEEKVEQNEEKEEKVDEAGCSGTRKKNEEMKEALGEAYDTVGHLKSVINEVNLLNAKLLYTNKLFRNFDLNEGQKMKVIENFDRAANTREAKLVFSTLAESFQKPGKGKRKVVKESKSLASKPVATTAPSKQTTQVLSEGFEQANRWKKLAGLI